MPLEWSAEISTPTVKRKGDLLNSEHSCHDGISGRDNPGDGQFVPLAQDQFPQGESAIRRRTVATV
jgi:hypothetical protein